MNNPYKDTVLKKYPDAYYLAPSFLLRKYSIRSDSQQKMLGTGDTEEQAWMAAAGENK